MKKISIIILFAIFFIGCNSNDYKQNSIPMSGIQLAQQLKRLENMEMI